MLESLDMPLAVVYAADGLLTGYESNLGSSQKAVATLVTAMV